MVDIIAGRNNAVWYACIDYKGHLFHIKIGCVKPQSLVTGKSHAAQAFVSCHNPSLAFAA